MDPDGGRKRCSNGGLNRNKVVCSHAYAKGWFLCAYVPHVKIPDL